MREKIDVGDIDESPILVRLSNNNSRLEGGRTIARWWVRRRLSRTCRSDVGGGGERGDNEEE